MSMIDILFYYKILLVDKNININLVFAPFGRHMNCEALVNPPDVENLDSLHYWSFLFERMWYSFLFSININIISLILETCETQVAAVPTGRSVCREQGRAHVRRHSGALSFPFSVHLLPLPSLSLIHPYPFFILLPSPSSLTLLPLVPVRFPSFFPLPSSFIYPTLLESHLILSFPMKAWEKMWEAISQAKGYVWISTFILEDDAIGRRTIKELSDAAKRGVRFALAFFHLSQLLSVCVIYSLPPLFLFLFSSYSLVTILSFQSGIDLRLCGLILGRYVQDSRLRRAQSEWRRHFPFRFSSSSIR